MSTFTFFVSISTLTKTEGVLKYPNQDSIYLYAIFHQANNKQDSLNKFPDIYIHFFHRIVD